MPPAPPPPLLPPPQVKNIFIYPTCRSDLFLKGVKGLFAVVCNEPTLSKEVVLPRAGKIDKISFGRGIKGLKDGAHFAKEAPFRNAVGQPRIAIKMTG